MTEVKKPRRPGSRPGEEKRGSKSPLFDVKCRDRLIAALKGGNYQDSACAFAGISMSHYYAALAKGRAERGRLDDGGAPAPDGADETFYLRLLDDVETARAEAKVRALALVQKAATDGHWQAAAWFLERTSPQEFGRSTRVVGPDGGPVQLGGTVHVTVDELASALDEIIDGKTE